MPQPNTIVICSDQHHPRHTGYRGHPHVKTPNLDALAAEGTAFTSACCNSPVCVPSRMSFITGKYAHQVGSWFLYVPLDRDEMTWARRLDRAGIESTMLGKLDLCGDYQDAGFARHKIIERRPAWPEYPRQSPFDARLQGYVRPDKRAHIISSGVREPAVTDGTDGHSDHLGFYDHDRIVTDWAVEYLRQKGMETTSRPWTLYVGLLYPHWPFCVPQEYFDSYYPDNVELPVDAHFPNNDLHPALRQFQGSLGIDGLTEEDLRRTIAAYYGMISCLDSMIGRIVDELKAQQLYDDTYLIYTSDHGESLGEHGLFYKQCSYEGSAGVPVIVRGPGLPAGRVVDQPVSLVDLYPTVLEMSGLETESDRPGRSWLPLIHGDTSNRDFVFSEFHGNFFRDSWYMIRTERYKYTYYCGNRATLYDMFRDPHELDDLAADLGHVAVLAEHEARLRSVVDPEAVAYKAKQDLGLIGPDGEDFTQTLTVEGLRAGRETGRFKPEPRLS